MTGQVRNALEVAFFSSKIMPGNLGMFSKKHGYISQISGHGAQECEMHFLKTVWVHFLCPKKLRQKDKCCQDICPKHLEPSYFCEVRWFKPPKLCRSQEKDALRRDVSSVWMMHTEFKQNFEDWIWRNIQKQSNQTNWNFENIWKKPGKNKKYWELKNWKKRRKIYWRKKKNPMWSVIRSAKF